jgi:hypothetical protein
MKMTLPGERTLEHFLHDTTSWSPVELTPFCFEEHYADGTAVRFRLGTHHTRWLWFDYHDEAGVSARSLPVAVEEVLKRLAKQGEEVKHLFGDDDFSAHVKAWIEEQPSRSKALEQDDPVLLVWHPDSYGTGAQSLRELAVDLSSDELAGIVSESTMAGLTSAVMPRQVAEGIQTYWSLPCEVIELVGSVTASEEEAETALALWQPHQFDEPRSSFTHVREMARAL